MPANKSNNKTDVNKIIHSVTLNGRKEKKKCILRTNNEGNYKMFCRLNGRKEKKKCILRTNNEGNYKMFCRSNGRSKNKCLPLSSFI
ncbi:hypothetical protein BgiBS90_030563 [Biomphalaria glabrata]|nr:hypothetical protein BgiBS90_030563 [Biomphalaria glabrata]